MSYNFLFVHGTGVREPAYTTVFNRIADQLTSRRNGVRVHRCYWGADHGTRLHGNGASVPGFETKRDPTAPLDDEEYTVGLWSLLYQDPLFEIRLLALKEDVDEFVPGVQPGDELDQAVRGLEPSRPLMRMLEAANLASVFQKSRESIVIEADYQEMIERAQAPFAEYRIAVASALVAQSVVLAKANDGPSSVTLSGSERDAIVNRLVTELGARERFIGNWIKGKFTGTIKRLATNEVDRRRGGLSEEAGGAVGDILMYQARGSGVRGFIRQTISAIDGPVVVIAHSLGGIAAVDLLIEAPIKKPALRMLVTVGSQAPLLYELNALASMPYSAGARLPQHFPFWLNVYDEHDFLSYKASPIFPEAQDVRVRNRQPFPESHSAYWGNAEVWDAILAKLP